VILDFRRGQPGSFAPATQQQRSLKTSSWFPLQQGMRCVWMPRYKIIVCAVIVDRLYFKSLCRSVSSLFTSIYNFLAKAPTVHIFVGLFVYKITNLLHSTHRAWEVRLQVEFSEYAPKEVNYQGVHARTVFFLASLCSTSYGTVQSGSITYPTVEFSGFFWQIQRRTQTDCAY
jgi:hypothetical protein